MYSKLLIDERGQKRWEYCACMPVVVHIVSLYTTTNMCMCYSITAIIDIKRKEMLNHRLCSDSTRNTVENRKKKCAAESSGFCHYSPAFCRSPIYYERKLNVEQRCVGKMFVLSGVVFQWKAHTHTHWAC